MIHVLHGEDLTTSYKRLTQIVDNLPDFAKVYLGKEHTFDDLYLNLFSEDLVSTKKVIICENLLKNKRITERSKNRPTFLKDVPKDKIIIFWEHTQLNYLALSWVKKIAYVENFRPKPELFWFLDSLSSSAKSNLKGLQKLSTTEENFVWNLNLRLLLLALAKLGLTKEDAQKIIGRPLLDWQWLKIINQAKSFELPVLTKLYTGSLRLDFMTKSGGTSLEPKDLIPFLFLKYLKN